MLSSNLDILAGEGSVRIQEAQEWWTAANDEEELHSTGCLAVTALGNDRYDKVMVGNYGGLLRVYSPCPSAFTPEHLLLEQRLLHPIVQLESGLLLPEVKELAVAVLHPRAIAVYRLSGSREQPLLAPVHSLPLPRTAHSMIIGTFGQATDQELVCIQSMDGQLSVVDHTGIIVSCFLPNFLLPGPLVYISRIDSLATITSGRQLEVFRYHNMCAASIAADNDTAQKTTAGKRLTSEWTVNMGELAVDMKSYSMEDGPSLILVLGKHSVFCLKDTGVFVFSVRLEFNPLCILPYTTASPSTGGGIGQPAVQYLLVSHSKQLMVMRNQLLLWSAALPHLPVDVKIAAFKDLQGVIVTMDEQGCVVCSYLGTDPTSLSPCLSSSPHFDTKASKAELSSLQSLIVNAGRQAVQKEPELIVEVHPASEPRHVKTSSVEDEGEKEEEQKCVEMKLAMLSSLPGQQLHDVSVQVYVEPPLSAHLSSRFFPAVDSTEEQSLLTLVCSSGLLALSRDVTVVTLYSTPAGLQRSSQLTIILPLSLFCVPCAPVKEARYKVTVETNHPLVSLSALYPELPLDSTPPNAFGFHTLAGPTVTVVASKYSDRYRVQSDSFPALFMFAEDLLQRLIKYHTDKAPRFTAQLTEPLPLPDYFELIEHHHKVRATLAQCKEMIGRHSHQFRAIQKRLLARFKDKTPLGLSNLDTLLSGSSQQLLALADKTEELEAECLLTGRHLSCATKLIKLLIQLKAELSEEQCSHLLGALSTHMECSHDLGWEEVTDAAVTQLLSTTLAKSRKDHSAALPELQLPQDCQKLKRHIALLCDRIQKGARPASTTTRSLAVPPHEEKAPPTALPTVNEETEL